MCRACLLRAYLDQECLPGQRPTELCAVQEASSRRADDARDLPKVRASIMRRRRSGIACTELSGGKALEDELEKRLADSAPASTARCVGGLSSFPGTVQAC